MAYHGPGATVMDPNIAYGLQMRRRNPKKKGRLPYHAKKVMQLQVMPNKSTCTHALSKHEELNVPHRYTAGRQETVTVSYALQCNVSHKATTKNPTHKDVAKRSWK